MKPKTGDWILPLGTTWMAKIIKKLTFGKVNHAAMVVDPDTVFETDGAWFKAKFNSLSKRFDDKEYYLVRPLFLRDNSLIQPLCKKYDGSLYSYWDIGVQAVFSWLHPKIRERIAGFLGNGKFMICSELTARITFEATGYKQLADWQGLTPEDLLEMAFTNPNDFQVEKKDKKKV